MATSEFCCHSLSATTSAIPELKQTQSQHIPSSPSTFALSRGRSSSSSFARKISTDALRHRRSFGAKGEFIRLETNSEHREKRRNHPFAFSCWLVHLGLVCSIGLLLLYSIYVVFCSKFYDASFGPQPIYSRHHDRHHTSTITRHVLESGARMPLVDEKPIEKEALKETLGIPNMIDRDVASYKDFAVQTNDCDYNIDSVETAVSASSSVRENQKGCGRGF